MDPLAILLVSPRKKQHIAFEKRVLKHFPETMVYATAKAQDAYVASEAVRWDLIFCVPLSAAHLQSTLELVRDLRSKVGGQTPMYVSTHNSASREAFLQSGCTDVIRQTAFNVFVRNRIRQLLEEQTVVDTDAAP